VQAEMVKSLIIGHTIGDALGVPVEFKPRHKLNENHVTNMQGYGTHNQPPGTWSDDTSMTLCLLESLSRLGRVDYDDIMNNFVSWMYRGEFTASGTVFDIGITIRRALVKYAPESKLIKKVPALRCGEYKENSNGNGSLMRIAPMALYLYSVNGNKLSWNDMEIVHNVSRLTHAHVRSLIACGIYVSIAMNLLDGYSLQNSISLGVLRACELYGRHTDYREELTSSYSRVLKIDSLPRLHDSEIKSTGYVVDTLEAVLWCLLNADNYCEAVLKAVNLGNDTDTVGAITGGLAGLAYGWKNIPPNWKAELKRFDYLESLCDDFDRVF